MYCGERSCVQYISFGNCTRCVTGDELEGPVKAANGVEAAARHDIGYLQVWLGIDDLHSFFNPHNIQILRKGHARLAFEVAGKVRFRNIHKQGGIVKGNFGLFYNIIGTNSLLYDTTDIIETFVYRATMTDFNFSTASAVGLYQSVVGFVIVMIVNYVVKKIEPDYSLF